MATVRTVLERVDRVPVTKEIVVVDDGSTDGTRNVLEELRSEGTIRNLRLFFHPRNLGKTAAVRTGIRAAQGQIILIQDADLEYDPRDYPKLIEPILDGRADVVYGSRFLGWPRRALLFWHSVANKLITTISNAFTNLNLTDMETCYKVFRADVIRAIPIRSKRFGFEAEITAKLARRHCRIYEVPISYAGRDYFEGKKITWRDGLHAIAVTIRYSLFPERTAKSPAEITLERVSSLERYTRFVYELIQPWLGRRVLEVGAGHGGLTRSLVNVESLVASDQDPQYLALLRRHFAHRPNVRVVRYALGEGEDQLGGAQFDTVVCSNVLEHIEDDDRALREMRGLLRPAGTLVLIVPALPSLFGEIDRAIGHYRRYEPDGLAAKLRKAGFGIEHTEAFNAIGIAGWWLNSKVLRRKSVPGLQARVNDLLVPWLRLERKLGIRIGMSLLMVGRRVGSGE